MSTIYEEEHEAVEELAAELYNPAENDSTFGLPNAWGVLRIDMTLMDEENRKKVYQAEILLREAGVNFDAGSGHGYRDWELDWSLSGAYLQVRPLRCMAEKAKVEKADWKEKELRHPMGGITYWAILRDTEAGCVSSYVFCSVECREREVADVVTGNYEHIVNVEGVNRSV